MDGAAEALFAASQGLLELIRGLGIHPAAVLGHSSGEYSALMASGALQLAVEP